MKWLPTLSIMLFSAAALADGEANPAIKPLHQAPPPNVQIIDGKRFYSLQNVHRFTGGTNNPKALSVMHHPRAEKPSYTHAIAQPALPTASAHTPEAMPKSASDQLLSIFTPEDKGLASPTPIK